MREAHGTLFLKAMILGRLEKSIAFALVFRREKPMKPTGNPNAFYLFSRLKNASCERQDGSPRSQKNILKIMDFGGN
jgi:hypothetical protein